MGEYDSATWTGRGLSAPRSQEPTRARIPLQVLIPRTLATLAFPAREAFRSCAITLKALWQATLVRVDSVTFAAATASALAVFLWALFAALKPDDFLANVITEALGIVLEVSLVILGLDLLLLRRKKFQNRDNIREAWQSVFQPAIIAFESFPGTLIRFQNQCNQGYLDHTQFERLIANTKSKREALGRIYDRFRGEFEIDEMLPQTSRQVERSVYNLEIQFVQMFEVFERATEEFHNAHLTHNSDTPFDPSPWAVEVKEESEKALESIARAISREANQLEYFLTSHLPQGRHADTLRTAALLASREAHRIFDP